MTRHSYFFGTSHHNNAYFFAKNFQQRYLPWFLKRELGWILVKQAIIQQTSETDNPFATGPLARILGRSAENESTVDAR